MLTSTPQRLSGFLAALLVLSCAAGCSETMREEKRLEALLSVRDETSGLYRTEMRQRLEHMLTLTRNQQEEFAIGRRPDAPTIDFLILSGGGDFGAFGAGVLKGWGTVPKSNPLHRPRFDVVTGVSTGALIAPFAFIGDAEMIERVNHLYRNPKPDWVKERQPLFFLPNSLSFAEVPGLERDVRENLNADFVARIAQVGGEGRVLAINATNLDDAAQRVFFMTPIAQEAVRTGDLSRIHNIVLASSGIPGAFPFREIDGHMFVDGCITNNILYGGKLREEDTVPAIWQTKYPDAPLPKIRYWVVFNNQFHAPPTTVRARWYNILNRSVELSVRSATLTSIRHLYSIAEISRIKRKADIEVRVMAIPDSWVPPVPGIFEKETMNTLPTWAKKWARIRPRGTWMGRTSELFEIVGKLDVACRTSPR